MASLAMIEHRGVPSIGGDVQAPRSKSPQHRWRCPSSEERESPALLAVSEH